jgi:hypothetical protein
MDAARRERTREMPARLQRLTCAEVRENMAIMGPPEHCIARMLWRREECQLSALICWFHPGGLLSSETVLTSRQRCATHVMPDFY